MPFTASLTDTASPTGAGPLPPTVPLDGGPVPLARFLAECAAAVAAPEGAPGPTGAHRVFLSAGIAALRAAREQEWAQFNVAVCPERAAELYAELASAVRGLRGDGTVREFFFMHKPPGLRLRFAAAPGRGERAGAEVDRLLRRWCARGLVEGARPAVYEPEAHLFGGPASMRHAHRLFTVDSLAWLDFHADPGGAPAWALSLAMLRPVFDGLRVLGWEDRDVWARVADAGRRMDAGRVDTAAAAARLRRWWADPAAALPEGARALAERHAEQARPLLERWWAECFDAGLSRLGPRQVAAHYVVFHWNRAALSRGRQVLLTAALAEVDDHDR